MPFVNTKKRLLLFAKSVTVFSQRVNGFTETILLHEKRKSQGTQAADGNSTLGTVWLYFPIFVWHMCSATTIISRSDKNNSEAQRLLFSKTEPKLIPFML